MKNLLLVSMSRADYWLMKSLFINFKDNGEFKSSFLISNQLFKEFENENKIEFTKVNAMNNIEIINYQNFEKSVETFFSIQTEFNNILKKKNYDLVILLGDRFETLAIAEVAFLRGLTIAHISGGETTYGSKDNEFRKCISIFSKIHFPAKQSHACELLKLGVDQKNIKVVGYMAIDNINLHQKQFVDRRKLLDKLGIRTNYEIVVVTYHPNTRNPDRSQFELETIIKFMESLKGIFFIITASNNDDGGKEINRRMKDWTLANPQKSKFFLHLGSIDYFNLLIHSNCLIGNSSSGLTEAAVLNVPVINIGDRQSGRHKEKNVHDCDFAIDSITDKYKLARKSSSRNLQGEVALTLASPSRLIIEFLKNYFRISGEE